MGNLTFTSAHSLPRNCFFLFFEYNFLHFMGKHWVMIDKFHKLCTLTFANLPTLNDSVINILSHIEISFVLYSRHPNYRSIFFEIGKIVACKRRFNDPQNLLVNLFGIFGLYKTESNNWKGQCFQMNTNYSKKRKEKLS